jgi:hypothetical protein
MVRCEGWAGASTAMRNLPELILVVAALAIIAALVSRLTA